MALGILINGNYITPDKGLTRTLKHKVRTQSFGDGYEYRIVDGINSLQEKFNVVFRTRTKEEITEISDYLSSTKNVLAFNLVVPSTTTAGAEETVKVICEDFDISYDYTDFYSLQARLKRVYE